MAITIKAPRIRLLDDRIAVRVDEPVMFTAGGIALPPIVRRGKTVRGTVVAVGPGILLKSGKRKTPGVKVGDRVMLGNYKGIEIKVHGESFQIIRETNVDLVIDGDEVDESGEPVNVIVEQAD